MKPLDQWDPRHKIGLCVGVSVGLLLYLAGILQNGFQTVNPFTIFINFFRKGLPIKIMLGIIIIVGIVGAVFYATHARTDAEKDVLGRNFFRTTKKQTYGDVHFETPKEFEKIAVVQRPEHAYGTILGQMDASGKRLINQRMDRSRDNRHIMVVGASGSGKSFTFTKPYCYQVAKRRESVIITDPDGGLYRDLAGYFQDQGYVVRRFDLKDLSKSDGWACLNAVKGANPELNAQLFANTVISNIAHGSDGIYASGPMTLLKACLLRVVLGDDYPEEEKTIESVYELLQNPAGEDYLNAKFDPYNLPKGAEPCLGPYMAFKQSSPNLRGNLITNLAVDLQLLQNKDVCRVLSIDDIDLELPGKQPCAYFCLFPDNHDTNQFIVSLFFSMLFIKLIDFADSMPNGQCPVPVNFLLDEFPSIGKLPDWDRKMATIRKRAMNAVMIFQDITQLQHNYQDTWVTLMSNCATFISLGINDGETASLISKRIGETTVEVETEKRNAMESIFSTYKPASVGGGKRNLMNYDELFRVDEDDLIILAQKHNPIYAKKYPHTLHPDAKKTRQILPSDIPPITDVEARAERRAKENAFIEQYLKDHPLSEVDRSYASVCEPDIEPTALDKAKEAFATWLKKTLDIRTVNHEQSEEDEDEVLPWELLEDGTDDNVWDEDFFDEAFEEIEVDLPSEPIIDQATGEVVSMLPQPAAEDAQGAQEQPLATEGGEPDQEEKKLLEAPQEARELTQEEAKEQPELDQKTGPQVKQADRRQRRHSDRMIPPPPPAQVLSPQTKDYPDAMYKGVKPDPQPSGRPMKPIITRSSMGGHGSNRMPAGTAFYKPFQPPTQKKQPTEATRHITPPGKAKRSDPEKER